MTQYRLSDDILIETDEVLHEEEIEKALKKGDPAKVARALSARLVAAEERPAVEVVSITKEEYDRLVG